MNKQEILDLMEEEHETLMNTIIEEIKRSAKLGRGQVALYLDAMVLPLTRDNQYYISHRLSELGYNVVLDQHLDRLTIGWY